MEKVDRVTFAGEIPVALLRKLVRRTIKRGIDEFLALAALLRVAKGNARNLRRASSVIVLRIPQEWSPATYRVLCEAFDVEDRRKSLHHVMHHPQPERGKPAEIDHEAALKRLHVFVLAEPDTTLVPEIEVTKNADISISICADRDLLALARLLHTGPLSAEDCEFLRGQSPSILSAIFRPGRSAKVAIGRLRTLKPKDNDAHIPSLETLPGLGEAGEWARGLAVDIDAWRKGNLPWAAIDKGMLLFGPPGTGKTLFARALATSCRTHFVPASLAKWQAMGHLGDTLKAMGKSFSEARNRSPSILFLDEIDAFGNRDEFAGDNAHYCTEVVNALLEHLDGSIDREGVVVIGACNRPDRIDPAILRSGRLEKHVFFNLPDEAARKEILGFYLPEIAGLQDFYEVAKRLRGWSHADLNRLSRDAKKNARREDRPTASIDDLRAALPDRTDASPELIYRFAAHEAGHAVCALASGRSLDHVSVSKEFDVADKTSSMGRTMLKDSDPPFLLKSHITERIAFYLGGIAAEDVLFQQRSTGGAGSEESDLYRATELSYALVATYGLGRRLTIVPKSTIDDLRRDGPLRAEVEDVLKEQYEVAKKIIEQAVDAVREIADRLVDTGHVSGELALNIFQKSHSSEPPLSAALEA